jgi:hypothetical protein
MDLARHRLAAAILLSAWSAGVAIACGDPFEAAARAPANVSLYLHVEAATEMRLEIKARPIVRGVNAVLAKTAVRQAWEQLAAATELDTGGLFDACLGERFTLLMRRPAGEAEWAVLTEVDPEVATGVLVQLKPRMLAPNRQVVILELPEHQLLVARHGRKLVIGPTERRELFRETAELLAVSAPACLAADPALAEARGLGPGRAGLFMRHAPPMGGWSAAVADWRADQLELSYTASFESPPFTTRPTRLEWDRSLLDAFEQHSILAFAEPTDLGDSPFGTFVRASLGQAVFPAEMRSNLGMRRVMVVAERDGRLQQPAFDLVYPTVARLEEVEDPKQAVDQLDRQMVGLVETLNELGGANLPAPLAVPRLAALRAGAPRRVDLGTAATWLLGDVPFANAVSLNWMVVSGPAGNWNVVATDPKLLSDVVGVLETPRSTAPQRGEWSNCGTLDGRRLSWQLRSLGDRADVFAAPQDVETFRGLIGVIAELSDGVERCRWRLSRPDVNRAALEAHVILSPGASAEETGSP